MPAELYHQHVSVSNVLMYICTLLHRNLPKLRPVGLPHHCL